MDRIDKIWKELSDIGGQLGDDVMFPKLLFADFVCFLPCCFFIKESKGVDIFMEQDMEDVWFQ